MLNCFQHLQVRIFVQMYKIRQENSYTIFCPKMCQYPPVYPTNTHLSNSSRNIGSISFFSLSDMHQSHHLLECYTTGINFSHNSFLSSLRFLNLIWLTKKLSWLDWKLKQFAWQRSCSDWRKKLKQFSWHKSFLRVNKITIFLIVTKITVFYN